LNSFYLACAALVVFSALFYMLPRGRRPEVEEDLAKANLQSFQRREEELAGEDEQLRQDALLRLIEDEDNTSEQSISTVSRFPGWPLFPLIALASAILYYFLGGYSDVLIAQRLSSLGGSSSPAQMESLIKDIEARVELRSGNLHYSSLLGRYYMAQEDYSGASQIYNEMLEEVPEDAQVLAYAAQAKYLAAGRNLSDKAQLLAEQSLAANPHQRTALGLLGMASYEQGQFRAAITYWERLLVMETPGSEAAGMITGVIEQARQQLGESKSGGAAETVAAVATEPAEGLPGVSVSVSLPEGASADPGATVFVLARNAASDSRMPLAVQRLRAAQLPITVRLDDRNSMAGQKISATPSVVVAVQVSPDGSPGEQGATYLGEAGPLPPSLDGAPVSIILQPTALASSAAATSAPAVAGLGVTVKVLLPDGEKPDPRSTVYVLARNAVGGGRMPVAVQRLSASALPLSLRLDDSNSMAGQKISGTASVIVAVQVSPSGQPGEANATFLGEAGPLSPSLDGTPIEIQLRPRNPG
jgi:cytochrome c-type biogenesis protein CcmH